MYTFKMNGKYFTAYKQNEVGNPHEKGYPCLVDLNEEIIPIGEQRPMLFEFFRMNNLDYHEIIHYDEKNINTHDLVNALIKFHDMKRI